MALDTPLQPLFKIKLKEVLDGLLFESKRLETALNEKIAALSELMPDDISTGTGKTSDELLQELENLSLQKMEEGLGEIIDGLGHDLEETRSTLIAIEPVVEQSIWKKICNFFLWLISRTSKAEAPETRQQLLTQAAPLTKDAIKFLTQKSHIDQTISETKNDLAKPNSEVETLKTAVKGYTSSKHEPPGAAQNIRRLKNYTASNDALVNIADALHAFLNTPNEGSRDILSDMLGQNPGYRKARCFSNFQKILERTQAVYGDIETPSDSTAPVQKEAAEPKPNESNTGRYGGGFT